MREQMVTHLLENIEKETDSRIKLRNLKHISELTEEAKFAIDILVKFLDDTDARVREITAQIIKKIGSMSDDIVKKLIETYSEEKDNDVKSAILEALGSSKSKLASPFLVNILNHEKNDFLRQNAVESLGILGFNEIYDNLVNALLNDSAANVRYAAANILKWIHNDDKIQPLLKALQNDEDSLVRSGAAWSLGSSHNNDITVPVLLESLKKEKDEYVRFYIIKTLAELKDERAACDLIEIADKDPDLKVRMIAIESVGIIGSNYCIDMLLDLYQKAPTKNIQNKIATTINFVGESAVEQLNKIKEKVKDEKDKRDLEKENQQLNIFRLGELQKIIRHFKSISVELFSELLHYHNTTEIYNWINGLPENLGISILEQQDYDKLIFSIEQDEQIREFKINQIVNNFKKYFKLDY
ncbi:MAG TPA: HEAT repeat domain-containing protein [Candidatus Bathyarchaeia archaeon]|nr:HEAT repeat domain-containing protein [Candidatus Bathyarchaeia archaeon]